MDPARGSGSDARGAQHPAHAHAGFQATDSAAVLAPAPARAHADFQTVRPFTRWTQHEAVEAVPALGTCTCSRRREGEVWSGGPSAKGIEAMLTPDACKHACGAITPSPWGCWGPPHPASTAMQPPLPRFPCLPRHVHVGQRTWKQEGPQLLLGPRSAALPRPSSATTLAPIRAAGAPLLATRTGFDCEPCRHRGAGGGGCSTLTTGHV